MRKYKKKLGSRNYKNYSSETLTKALNEIRSKKLSLNQFVRALVHILMKTAEWGFPVVGDDLRHIVKAYLDKQGKTVGQFCQNIPGKDWRIAAKLKKVDSKLWGIFPINRDQVLKKLPKDVTENENGSAISDSLLEFLQKSKRRAKTVTQETRNKCRAREDLREELAEYKKEEEAILTHNTIEVGDYILVRFATKRTVKHYVGEIITHLSPFGPRLKTHL
ncbi:hypothetical protein ILUMI_24224 [Ignelater luminosus]|uniref:Uncharacterized protein n=1 Tax=Ignelater luminosus TaxID=2038154 RepID=A0A8K0CAX2_IGNLU|nr:hypothetical protein ILUMI_24224 [Ignelater luminosus]